MPLELPRLHDIFVWLQAAAQWAAAVMTAASFPYPGLPRSASAGLTAREGVARFIRTSGYAVPYRRKLEIFRDTVESDQGRHAGPAGPTPPAFLR